MSKRTDGFASRTQLFSSAAAFLQYTWLCRAIASIACRRLEVPRFGHCGVFGIVAPEAFVKLHLRASANLPIHLFTTPKLDESEADSDLEVSGLALSFCDECEGVTARFSLPKERIDELVTFALELRVAGRASLATLRKLAGKLRFAQTAVVGRFGRAAPKLLFDLIAKGGGDLSRTMRSFLRWSEEARPNIAPRLALR